MLLAQQDDRPLIEFTLAPLFEDYGIPLAVMGIFVVFMALVLVVVFITLLPRVLALGFGETEAKQATPMLASGRRRIVGRDAGRDRRGGRPGHWTDRIVLCESAD